ncbi:tRNA isopentenyltransferase [Phlegmacium glaucopus]|nr:tRNA isopentenyltransferase [Phlegmacium glaucopus]
MAMAVPLKSIITICGTTGVGKSKLAIDLALHINRSTLISGWRRAKIINADAMQVYKGLDVITNKVLESERQGVEHLLMDFKQPGEQYVVGDWVQDTLKLINEMHENHELPIVVGGTSYWMQHLIFPNRLVSQDSGSHLQPSSSLVEPSWSEQLSLSIASLPPDLLQLLQHLPQEPPSAKVNPDEAFRLHSLLSILDPVISQRWHWKDTRKVLRSLQIIKECRQRPSDIIVEQSAATADSKPRFHTLCFWLYAEPSVLHERLDARVDSMISQGLLDEVRSLRRLANSTPNSPSAKRSSLDFTLGIYQSIGYREFCGYLESPSDAAYAEALACMKTSTWQYAKRQISWIRNKLIPAVNAANVNETLVPLYLLDATALGEKWITNVQTPATDILERFLLQQDIPDPKLLSETASRMLSAASKDVSPISVLVARRKQICPVCTLQADRPVMIEEGPEWTAHQKTRGHRRAAKRLY